MCNLKTLTIILILFTSAPLLALEPLQDIQQFNVICSESGYPIICPKKGGLKPKACSTEARYSFSGTEIVPGKYYFGLDPLCENREDGCMSLHFYPDDASILPQFKNFKYSTFEINIINYREAAQELIGKPLSDKIISATKTKIKETAEGVDFGSVMAANGSATVVITDYYMEICCDSPWTSARILQVKKKSMPQQIEYKPF